MDNINFLFESPSFGMEKLGDGSIIIHDKHTNQKAIFAPYAAQGIINSIYQQADMGNDYDVSLERLGQILQLKGCFF